MPAVRFSAIVKDLRHRKHNYPSLRDSIKAASPTLRALLRRLHRLHVTITATHNERHVTTSGLVRVCSVPAACVCVRRKAVVVNAAYKRLIKVISGFCNEVRRSAYTTVGGH